MTEWEAKKQKAMELIRELADGSPSRVYDYCMAALYELRLAGEIMEDRRRADDNNARGL